MAVTEIDSNSALVIIDLQRGIAGLVAADVIDEIVHKSRDLANAFRKKGLPVVLVTADGGAPGRAEQSRPLQGLPPGFTDILPALGEQPEDIKVTKRTWGAFASTDLETRLRTLGVSQVVITGVATSIGVESTARQAFEAGFNVTLAIDAMTDLRPEAHEASITYIFPRLGETGTTADIIALLEKNA